jgi:hypothetical protein
MVFEWKAIITASAKFFVCNFTVDIGRGPNGACLSEEEIRFFGSRRSQLI